MEELEITESQLEALLQESALPIKKVSVELAYQNYLVLMKDKVTIQGNLSELRDFWEI